MTTIQFTIPGAPVPKARARVGKFGAYTPKRTKDYEAKVKALALVARQKARQRVWTGPVGMRVVFYMRDAMAKIDLTNLLKGVEDACNGIIYADDSQIVALSAEKVMVNEGGETGANVFFWRT